jgi:hypothetical protein
VVGDWRRRGCAAGGDAALTRDAMIPLVYDSINENGDTPMKLRYITPALTTIGIATAIIAAPSAMVADTQVCSTAGTGSACQSPGNVKINDSAPVQFAPQYPY